MSIVFRVKLVGVLGVYVFEEDAFYTICSVLVIVEEIVIVGIAVSIRFLACPSVPISSKECAVVFGVLGVSRVHLNIQAHIKPLAVYPNTFKRRVPVVPFPQPQSDSKVFVGRAFLAFASFLDYPCDSLRCDGQKFFLCQGFDYLQFVFWCVFLE